MPTKGIGPCADAALTTTVPAGGSGWTNTTGVAARWNWSIRGCRTSLAKTGRPVLSTAAQPGAVNSVAATDSAPLILDFQQSPILPRAVDPVTIQTRIVDELTAGVQVVLHWRVDGAPDFVQTAMRDDGQAGDLVAGDGVFQATIPPQADRTVIEYYIAAQDVSAHGRTWPAATADSGQVTNALYQVIDEFDPAAAGSRQPHRCITKS